jgi:hypothetical protein
MREELLRPNGLVRNKRSGRLGIVVGEEKNPHKARIGNGYVAVVAVTRSPPQTQRERDAYKKLNALRRQMQTKGELDPPFPLSYWCIENLEQFDSGE